MTGPRYRLYVKNAVDLARSLTIKNELTARAINQELEYLGYNINPLQPETWKYYLNLSGQYHAYDQMMQVRSLDTLELIDLTRENLLEHRATASIYREDSRFYGELVREYPEQELLIRGILFPVAMDKAIAAEDGIILNYDRALVEENETNLIPELQQWVTAYFTRWNVPAYAAVDDLYAPALLGVMFSFIPKVILNIRLANCKTDYVHSFHIREYLASHGRLDVFMDYLTKKQALFLYRNIRYLQRHAGKQETFQLLLQRLLTERGIPLASYEIRHNLEHLAEELYPKVELLLTYLNFQVGEDARMVREVSEVLEKQVGVARGNYNENDDAIHYVPERVKQSMNDRLPTKVYESIVTDLSRETSNSYEELLLNHWLYTSTHGRYNAYLSITNPLSGQQFSVSAKDAFVIYLYAYNRACGITLQTIPTLKSGPVWRPRPPDFAELRAVTETKRVTDELIQEALRDNPLMGSYISTHAFHDFCEAVQAEINRHRYLYATQRHFVSRGQAEGMLMRFFHQPDCLLGEEDEYYEDWFEERGLSVLTELGVNDSGILASDILKAATGIDLRDNRSLRELQGAMLRLMSQLSSYTVHFLQTITSNTFLRSGWSAIRLGDTSEKGLVRFQIDRRRSSPLHTRARLKTGTENRAIRRNIFRSAQLSYSNAERWEIGLEMVSRSGSRNTLQTPIIRAGIRAVRAIELSD